MTNNNLQKLETIEYIKQFAFEGKFCEKDLKIFSNKYLGAILFNMYKNNNNLYTFIYGDFNKLSKLNSIYGKSIVDSYLKQSLQLILNNLPSNSFPCRISGDEFAILVDKASATIIESCIKRINDLMKERSEDLKGLSITLAATDSRSLDSIGDVYFTSESKVQKLKREQVKLDEQTPQENLKNKIDKGFQDFFDFYRLPQNFKITKPRLRDLRDTIINIVFEKLEQPNDNSERITRNSKVNILSNISSQTAYHINEIVNGNIEVTDNLLNNLNASELDHVLNYLINEPLSGEFSKDYFLKYLLPEFSKNPEDKLHIYLFNLTHLKLSNEIIGHPNTDIKMEEMFSNITKELRENHNFSSTPFCVNKTDNFIVQYGPNLVVLFRDNSLLSNEELSELLKKARINQNILNLVTSDIECNSTVLSFEEAFFNLKEKTKKEKENIKAAKFTSPKSKIALETALEDSISYYKDYIPDSSSLNSKKELIRMLFSGAVDAICEKFNKDLKIGDDLSR